MRHLCRAVAAAFVIAAGGCALNPVSGRPELVLVSASRERELGKQEAQAVERDPGLVRDAALSAYIESVGQRLAAHSPRQDVAYQFRVVDASEPNAFALPGGYVYVTRGLLALVNSEDELAGVIGHEIGHVAARHAVQRLSRGAPLAIVTNLGAAITGIASPLLGQVVGGVGQLASGLVLAPYSREQERQADRVGQQLAAAAGWDPGALPGFLTTLHAEESLHGTTRGGFGFLNTHPSTPERVANTATYAATLQPAAVAPISSTRADFLAHLDGLVIGAPAANGVFDGQRFLHPELDFTIQCPGGWNTQNGREEVAAVAPAAGAFIVLSAVAKGDDPMTGARALQQSSGAPVVENTQRLTIGSLPAAHTRTRTPSDAGELLVDLTWIAHAGHVYQILGVTPLRRANEIRPVFERVSTSFRPLTPAERAGIRETRLRLITARDGETLRELVTRARSTWSVRMVAVANALPPEPSLAKDQMVKLAVAEPYVAARVP
jgi:predicted Zn-dependent protease